MNSNLEFRRWNKVSSDKKLTAALLYRLVHHTYILAFNEESYRLKNTFSSV
ncbi:MULTISPECIES: ATP-binding protein [Bacillus]|uniref:ATP-binding protein n=1 Tax=Bacillus TaxID=1386 RepID=UPI0009AFD224|nr:ATP-binding protein [Bacillus cereus]